MTYKENIMAILECHFGGFKQEIIDSACNRILELEPCEYAPFTIDELKDEDMQKLLRGFKNQQVIITDNDCSPSVTIIEPCEDAISREQAMAIIYKIKENYRSDRENHPINYGTLCDINLQLVNLPPVTPKARWIPCNERLPKENEYVGDVCKYYLIQDEYGDMHVAHLSKVGWIPMDSLKAIGNEIIAWQELPKSYVPEINVGKMEESDDRMNKDTTCENCIYANECIMYEPKMKRCKDYKESEDKQ